MHAYVYCTYYGPIGDALAHYAYYYTGTYDINVPANSSDPVILWEPASPIHPETVKDAPKALVGEPINTIDGSVVHTVTDFVIPAPGIPLGLTRYYNSALTATGALSYGWTHTYEARLSTSSEVVTVTGNNISQTISNNYQVMTMGNGESLWFLELASGGYRAPSRSPLWSLVSDTNGAYVARSPQGVQYTFDGTGRLIVLADPWANSLVLTYSNQCVSEVRHSCGYTARLDYAQGRLTTVHTPSEQLRLDYTYNTNDELQSAVTAGSVTSTVSYAYAYSAAVGGSHSLTQIVDAVGTRTEYWYQNNATGQPTSCCTGMVVNDTYSGLQLVVLETNSAGARTQVGLHEFRGEDVVTNVYHIGATGDRIEEVTAAPGCDRRLYAHDANGTLIGTVTTNDVTGCYVQASYLRNGFNNVVSQGMAYCRSPSNWWTCTWDTNWDEVASLTDPEGHREEWEYTNGLVIAERSFPVTNVTLETRYTYTANGLLAGVTNANGHWLGFQYDSLGCPTQSSSQVGLTNWMTWDSLGHLKEIRRPTESYDTNEPPNMIPSVISFDPDELGRVRKITYPDNSFETFAFDGNGNLTNYVDAAGRTNRYAWLPTRKLASTTRFLTGVSNQAVTVGVEHDEQMNVLEITDELGRAVETYQLDLQDRPTKVTNVESQEMSIAWALANCMQSVVRFDGTTNTFAYDEAGRIKQADYPDETVTFRITRTIFP